MRSVVLGAGRFAGALGRDRGGRFLHDGSLTWRGLVAFYTVFVIDLASRRAIVGVTPHPDEAFMARSVARSPPRMTGSSSAIAADLRPRSRGGAGSRGLGEAGDPRGADAVTGTNANAYAERFVRWIKHECLNL